MEMTTVQLKVPLEMKSYISTLIRNISIDGFVF